MFKRDLEKPEEPAIKLQASTGSQKKQEFQKNIYFCFIDDAEAFERLGGHEGGALMNEISALM